MERTPPHAGVSSHSDLLQLDGSNLLVDCCSITVPSTAFTSSLIGCMSVSDNDVDARQRGWTADMIQDHPNTWELTGFLHLLTHQSNYWEVWINLLRCQSFWVSLASHEPCESLFTGSWLAWKQLSSFNIQLHSCTRQSTSLVLEAGGVWCNNTAFFFVLCTSVYFTDQYHTTRRLYGSLNMQ